MNGLGPFTMTGTHTYTGGTNVQSGTLISNVNFSNGPLSITGGLRRSAPKHPAAIRPACRLSLRSRSPAPPRCWITNNALVIDYTARQLAVHHRSEPDYHRLCRRTLEWAWHQQLQRCGRFHLVPQDRARLCRGVGAGMTSTGMFDGHTVDSSSVLVRYTLAGDANLDGIVNAQDFDALATNYGKSGRISGRRVISIMTVW